MYFCQYGFTSIITQVLPLHVAIVIIVIIIITIIINIIIIITINQQKRLSLSSFIKDSRHKVMGGIIVFKYKVYHSIALVALGRS